MVITFGYGHRGTVQTCSTANGTGGAISGNDRKRKNDRSSNVRVYRLYDNLNVYVVSPRASDNRHVRCHEVFESTSRALPSFSAKWRGDR